MDNRYLRDRARRRMSSRSRRDHARRGMSRRRHDSRSDYRYEDERYEDYEHREPAPYIPHYSVGHYLYDGEYDDEYDAKEYHKDLEEWMHKLKHHDHFGLSKEEVLKKAKDMGVRFKDYDELEFYVTYLMMISDYKHVPNDPHQYLTLAKEWLEDDDVERKGSEKLCAYYYSIVLGED